LLSVSTCSLAKGSPERGLNRFQRDYVVRPEPGYGSTQHRLDALSFADLAADVPRDAIVRRTAHEAQCLAHALVGKQSKKGRLAQLHGERLFQRAVEHRLAGCVDEVSQQTLCHVRSGCAR
jgi:hypothetical protein